MCIYCKAVCVTLSPQVVLLSADYKHLYVSTDSGNSWHKHQTPSDSFDDVGDMLLSSVNSKRIIITDNTSQVLNLYSL